MRQRYGSADYRAATRRHARRAGQGGQRDLRGAARRLPGSGRAGLGRRRRPGARSPSPRPPLRRPDPSKRHLTRCPGVGHFVPLQAPDALKAALGPPPPAGRPAMNGTARPGRPPRRPRWPRPASGASAGCGSPSASTTCPARSCASPGGGGRSAPTGCSGRPRSSGWSRPRSGSRRPGWWPRPPSGAGRSGSPSGAGPRSWPGPGGCAPSPRWPRRHRRRRSWPWPPSAGGLALAAAARHLPGRRHPPGRRRRPRRDRSHRAAPRRQVRRPGRGQAARPCDPTVVAITGSYGKTGTKGYVAHLVAGQLTRRAHPGQLQQPGRAGPGRQRAPRPGHRRVRGRDGHLRAGRDRRACARGARRTSP